jgi:NAD-dependent DNA ligase
MVELDRMHMMVGQLVMVTKTPFTIYSHWARTCNDPLGTMFFCTGISLAGRNNYRADIIHGETLAQIELSAIVCVKDPDFLNGYRICMTGACSRFSKPAMKLVIESLGGEVVPSPKKATHFLQGNIENSLKLRYAEENKVPTMNFNQFKALVEPAIIGL